MGTYITCKLKPKYIDIAESVNALWNCHNKSYENTFHLNTAEDIQADIDYIHSNPGQEHLRYIKTVDDFNKTFSLWGVGTFQVKITFGDYLCSEMARRYLKFFDEFGDKYFIENPVKDDYIRGILEDVAGQAHKTSSCSVKCLWCRTPLARKTRRIQPATLSGACRAESR